MEYNKNVNISILDDGTIEIKLIKQTIKVTYSELEDMAKENGYFKDIAIDMVAGEEKEYIYEAKYLLSEVKLLLNYYPDLASLRVTSSKIFAINGDGDIEARIKLRDNNVGEYYDPNSIRKLSDPKEEVYRIIEDEEIYFAQFGNIKQIAKKLSRNMPLAPYYALCEKDKLNETQDRLEYISLFLNEPRQRNKGETRKAYKENILAEKMMVLESLGIKDIEYNFGRKNKYTRTVLKDALKARKNLYAEIIGMPLIRESIKRADNAKNIKFLYAQVEAIEQDFNNFEEQANVNEKPRLEKENNNIKNDVSVNDGEGLTNEEYKLLFEEDNNKKKKISLSKTIEATKKLGNKVVEVLNKGVKKAENIYWDMRVDMVKSSTRRKGKRKEKKEIKEKRRDRLNTKIKKHTGINFKAIGEQCTHMKELIKESKAGNLKDKISEKYKNNKKKILGVAIGVAAFAIAFTGISNHVVQSQSVGNTQQTQQTQLKANTFDNIESNILGNINMDKLSINEQGGQETLKQENVEEDKDIDFEDAMIDIFDFGIGSEFNMDEGEINTQANGNGTIGNYKHAKEDHSKDIECKIAGIAVIAEDGSLKGIFEEGETLKDIENLYPDEQISILSAKKDGSIIGWDAKNYDKIIDRMINGKVHNLKKYLNAQEIQALIEAKETGKINLDVVKKLQQIIDEQQQGIDIDDDFEI